MTASEDARALVLRMQECFNSRQFDQARDLFTADFYSHALGVTGFDGSAWRVLTDRFPEWRVVAEDILVDGDKVAIRSSVEGAEVPDDGPRPTLFEIFRIEGGRLAEMWGASEGVDPSRLV